MGNQDDTMKNTAPFSNGQPWSNGKNWTTAAAAVPPAANADEACAREKSDAGRKRKAQTATLNGSADGAPSDNSP